MIARSTIASFIALMITLPVAAQDLYPRAVNQGGDTVVDYGPGRPTTVGGAHVIINGSGANITEVFVKPPTVSLTSSGAADRNRFNAAPHLGSSTGG